MKARVFIISFLMLAALCASAQKSELKQAQRYYDRLDYQLAVDQYDLLMKHQYKQKFSEMPNEHQLQYAVSCYYVANFPKSVDLFSQIPLAKVTGDFAYIYAKSLVRCAKYEDALRWFEKSKQALYIVTVMQVMVEMDACRWAMANSKPTDDYKLRPCPEINVAGKSLGTTFLDDKVYYSRAQKPNAEDAKWLLRSLDHSAGVVNGKSEKKVSTVILPKDLSIGSVSFTPDKKNMYYTKVVTTKGGDLSYKLYVARDDNRGGWHHEVQLPFSDDNCNYAFPSLSPDGQVLFFSSDRPGGMGGMDLWMCEVKGESEFGELINLGSNINSYADEIYPRLLTDGRLYFSSNGLNGFGGYDIFSARYYDGDFIDVRNLMMPLNSSVDDFAFVVCPKNGALGLVSSNRDNDAGTDAVYYVDLKNPLPLATDMSAANPHIDTKKVRINVSKPKPTTQPALTNSQSGGQSPAASQSASGTQSTSGAQATSETQPATGSQAVSGIQAGSQATTGTTQTSGGGVSGSQATGGVSPAAPSSPATPSAPAAAPDSVKVNKDIRKVRSIRYF